MSLNSLVARGILPEDDWIERKIVSVHAFAKKHAGKRKRRILLDQLYDLRIRADYREQTVTREDIYKHVNEANKLLDNYLDEASQAFDAV